MRCQRCGFEIEPNQTFCSMCGTEQSKALREKDKKIESILWVIKVASMDHAKMYLNLALIMAVIAYIIFACADMPVQIPYICLAALLFFYILIQCLIPYKNPNSSKSKKYKIGRRVSFVLIILLFVLILLGDFSLIELAKW